MSNGIPPKILETLKGVVKGHIEDFEISVHDNNKKGEGFLGEMVFVTLKKKNSDEALHLAVKQAFTNQSIRDMHPIRDIYVNEIYFYSKVWQELNRFQEGIDPAYQFQKLSKCLIATSEENSEMVVLENLKNQKFAMHEKRKFLDQQHFELIFKEYGKFHALSFAYKALHPEHYSRLVAGTNNIFLDMGARDYFEKGNILTHEACLKHLIPGIDDAVIEKYKRYPEICTKLFAESVDCNTKYTAIIHGDCWSNNMMFKYDENKRLTDVRFLDFQMATEGSPCCDLSYCLYSGASKEALRDLDYYLHVYHDSLSETLKQFGCDSNELYPYHELKNDWKRHCKLGFIMALFIWRIKLTDEDEIKDLEDMTKMSDEEMMASKYDEDEYARITRDLILHLYDNDFL